MSTQIALVVSEDHALVGMVRQMGRTLLAYHDVAPQDIDDLEAVIGELCANVTRHARSERGYYRVTLEHHGDHIVLTVADEGRGFDPGRVPPIGTPRGDADGTLRLGGYGLHLVDSLVDRLEFRRTQPRGTTVRAEKRLRSGGPRAMTSSAG